MERSGHQVGQKICAGLGPELGALLRGRTRRRLETPSVRRYPAS